MKPTSATPTKSQVEKIVNEANNWLSPNKPKFAEKPLIFADFFYGYPENMRDYPSFLRGAEQPEIEYVQNELGYSPAPHSGGRHGGPVFHEDSWYGWYIIELSRIMKERGEPISVMIRNYNCPFPYGDEADERGQPEAFQYMLDNIAQLDYLLMDLESDREMVERNVREIHRMVREHPDPRINQARIGNYSYSGMEYDEGMIWPNRRDRRTRWDNHDPVQLYHDCLDVSMPVCYPYETASVHANEGIQGKHIAPNPRAAIFWQGLERMSAAARSLPEGHMLIPWVGEYIYHRGGEDLYNAPRPSEADNRALIMHIRLRGADCFYMFAQPFQEYFVRVGMEAWKTLDALFCLPVEKKILNLETDKRSGVQWSGVEVAGIKVILVSNLSDQSTQVGSHVVAPGEHKFVLGDRMVDLP